MSREGSSRCCAWRGSRLVSGRQGRAQLHLAGETVLGIGTGRARRGRSLRGRPDRPPRTPRSTDPRGLPAPRPIRRRQTRVNGAVRLRRTGRLRDGDRIQLGQTLLVFRSDEEMGWYVSLGPTEDESPASSRLWGAFSTAHDSLFINVRGAACEHPQTPVSRSFRLAGALAQVLGDTVVLVWTVGDRGHCWR